jgi:hypothetical protein
LSRGSTQERRPAETYCLAFLAPDLQAAILQGSQARRLTLTAMMAQVLPLSTASQRHHFGAEAASKQVF